MIWNTALKRFKSSIVLGAILPWSAVEPKNSGLESEFKGKQNQADSSPQLVHSDVQI